MPPAASQPAGTVIAPSACTRRRSRAGITCTTLASARTDASAMPSTAPGAPAPCVRGETRSCPASSSPGQYRRVCSRDSRRSVRELVFTTIPILAQFRSGTGRYSP